MRWRGGAVTIAVFAMLVPAASASAAVSTDVVQGQVLRLVSVADWAAASSLMPGESVQWDVQVSADAPDPGTVDIGLSATGDAPLVADVSLCMQEWTPSGCPGGAEALRSGWEIPRDGIVSPLAEISDTEVANVRVMVALAGEAAAGSTHLRLHADGAGESAVIGDGGGLATTGMSPVVYAVLGVGAGLLMLGVVLLIVRRRRSGVGTGDSGGGTGDEEGEDS